MKESNASSRTNKSVHRQLFPSIKASICLNQYLVMKARVYVMNICSVLGLYSTCVCLIIFKTELHESKADFQEFDR